MQEPEDLEKGCEMLCTIAVINSKQLCYWIWTRLALFISHGWDSYWALILPAELLATERSGERRIHCLPFCPPYQAHHAPVDNSKPVLAQMTLVKQNDSQNKMTWCEEGIGDGGYWQGEGLIIGINYDIWSCQRNLIKIVNKNGLFRHATIIQSRFTLLVVYMMQAEELCHDTVYFRKFLVLPLCLPFFLKNALASHVGTCCNSNT